MSSKPIPQGVSKGWYSEAVAKIEDIEYRVQALDPPGQYGAINHAQHLGYWFNDQGYEVKNFNDDGSASGIWQAQFVMAGLGRKGNTRNCPFVAAISTSDHSVRMDYSDYSITYDNEKPGMEQSFFLRKRPSGTGRLEIVMELKGDLAARIGDRGQLLLYTPGHPKDVRLTYDQLTVWDRNNKKIPAVISLKGRSLVLSVDDRAAAYPVTVDPFTSGVSTTLSVDDILGTTLNDITSTTLYGYSVSGAGDVDGDGVADIIIGAPLFAQIMGYTGGKLHLSNVSVTGAAFIYLGNNPNGPSTSPSKVLEPSGLAAGALFGFSVSTTGNAISASNSGVIIGAPGDEAGTTQGYGATVVVGKVYMYTAKADFTGGVGVETTPDFTLYLPGTIFPGHIPNHNILYGFSVADAGDVNGDGIDDIAIGSPIYQNGGRVDLYYGNHSLFTTTSGNNIQGSIVGENLGFSISSAGHFHSTTVSDLIVGAPGCIAATGGILQGHAYVFYGGSGGITAGFDNNASGAVGQTLTQPGTNLFGTLFGFSVSTAGDVDNDGHGDLVIGAPLVLSGAGANGSAYIYYGGTLSGSTFTPSLTMATLTSPRAAGNLNLLFGYSVGNAGNVTGDAAGDILVGEPGSLSVSNPILQSLAGITASTSTISGQAYVYAGHIGTGVGSASSPSSTINDPIAPNALGASVHTAGDVNGDGVADYLIGEPSGVLDLGFNYTLLDIQEGGFSPLGGTLTIGTHSSKGLLATGGVGNVLVNFGTVSTLPVTLMTFTGQAEGNGVLLNWATAQEQNSSYFEIDRSADNQNFSAIGQVGAAGNSTQVTHYSFTDGSPLTGNNYYRLKMVNEDGSFVYSQIVVVNFGGSSMSAVSVYPNPAHGSFTLLFRNMTPGRYEVSLLSAIGQTVQTTMVQVTDPASDNETINISSGLAASAYFIRIVDQQSHVSVIRLLIN